jgi:hypothetical protein
MAYAGKKKQQTKKYLKLFCFFKKNDKQLKRGIMKQLYRITKKKSNYQNNIKKLGLEFQVK